MARNDLLMRIFACVTNCACGGVDGAGCLGVGNAETMWTNAQDRLGFSSRKEMGAVLIGREGSTGALGGLQ